MAADDEPVDDGDEGRDPDRAAILARRQRFIALAISGLASAGCRHGGPEPCLSVVAPEDHSGEPSGPFVEDPGAPLDTGGESGAEGEGQAGAGPEGDPGARPEPPPQPCLNVLAPQPQPTPKPAPKPCLKKKAPSPKVCLIVAGS